MLKKLILVIFIVLISCINPGITDDPVNDDFIDVKCDDGSISDCDIWIDFNEVVGNIDMYYGANENDHWDDFVEIEQTHMYHRQVGSEYIRVWISDEDYIKSTIPLIDYEYDFSELDEFINAVLDSGAIPFIVFANAPESMRDSDYSPPWDIYEFADYTAIIVSHYKHACENDLFEYPCDTSDWYFEVWNEPWQAEWWWDDLYIELFNAAYASIKSIEPDAKVGGYSLAYHKGKTDKIEKFISSSDMDFISIHHYGNSMDEYNNDKEKIEQAKILFYDSIKDLKQEVASNKDYEVEIINSEYNSDYKSEYIPRLDEDFTKMWYASALIWQIQSGVDIEMFYSGTTKYPDRGYGMWSVDDGLKTWPIFEMKTNFVMVNTRASKIFKNTLSDNVDVLAVENHEEKYITIVNKLDEEYETRICLNPRFDKALDLNSMQTYSISSCFSVPLGPYEVRFLKLT